MPNVLSFVLPFVFALLVVLIFGPAKSLFHHWLRRRRRSDHVLVEDALKHLYDCAYHGHNPTLQSLSGTLNLSGGRTAALLEHLGKLDLVRLEHGALVLSPEGTRYALRVIRVHRLWEHYLAEQTGVEATQWHSQADEREHTLGPAETEALAARMGYPHFDPHGDPIPTAAGEIAPPQGQPLIALPAGQMATIVHLEDEPDTVFAHLTALGLHPGMHLQILESTAKHLRFWVDGKEQVLSPVFAANITVIPLPEPQKMGLPHLTLDTLAIGQTARIAGLAHSCRGPQRRRLLDLGLIAGTPVKAEMRSAAGDPTAYRIRGGLIALRADQAAQIHLGAVS
jgi:DtxR family transcriptional regulator, Mn-dependent transcriptional regulator